MDRVGGVATGELVNAFQAIGQGAHTQTEPARRLRGDAPGVEVRAQGVDQRLGTAACALQRAQGVTDEISRGLAVAGEDRVDE